MSAGTDAPKCASDSSILLDAMHPPACPLEQKWIRNAEPNTLLLTGLLYLSGVQQVVWQQGPFAGVD